MNFDVVRAWKDEEYRLSLSEEERRNLPENPVGEIELTDTDLEAIYGGQNASIVCISFICVSQLGGCLSFGCSNAVVCL